jgi:hypothetical protein
MTVTQFGPRHRWRQLEVALPLAWSYRPLAAAGTGLLMTLLAAWGGIVAFVGPMFGFRATASSSWQWTTNNWLLHLVPGAVGVLAGIMVLLWASSAAAGARDGLRLAALMALAAGAWFVIGPAAWPAFEPSSAYHVAATSTGAFLYRLGANLGPGFLLGTLGGTALKASAPVAAVLDGAGEPGSSAPPSAQTDPTAIPASPQTEASRYTRAEP